MMPPALGMQLRAMARCTSALSTPRHSLICRRVATRATIIPPAWHSSVAHPPREAVGSRASSIRPLGAPRRGWSRQLARYIKPQQAMRTATSWTTIPPEPHSTTTHTAGASTSRQTEVPTDHGEPTNYIYYFNDQSHTFFFELSFYFTMNIIST